MLSTTRFRPRLLRYSHARLYETRGSRHSPIVLPSDVSSASPDSTPAPSTPGAETLTSEQRQTQEPPASTLPPPPPDTPSSQIAAFPTPPFHTHEFFLALCRSFPEPVARNLMKATRALLVHRMDVMQDETLGKQDLENVRYWAVILDVIILIVIACLFVQGCALRASHGDDHAYPKRVCGD